MVSDVRGTNINTEDWTMTREVQATIRTVYMGYVQEISKRLEMDRTWNGGMYAAFETGKTADSW